MEALSKMITATMNRCLLSGFFVGSRPSGVVNISRFLFMDDTLVFCGPIMIIFAICVVYSYVLKLFMC